MRRVLLAAVLCAGCPGPSGPVLLFDERFEDPALPAWTVDGAVQQVTTLDAGEHGLRFAGPTTMTAPLSIMITMSWQDGDWLEYATACRADTEVWSELDGSGANHIHATLVLTPDGGDWRKVRASFPPLGHLNPNNGEYTGATVDGLVVSAPAGSPCAIDNLRVWQPAEAGPLY